MAGLLTGFPEATTYDKARPAFNTCTDTRRSGSAERADQGHFETGRHTGEITMMQYPATIKKISGSYLVSFVDFDNINTWGETIEKALAKLKRRSTAISSLILSGASASGTIREKRTQRLLYPRTAAYCCGSHAAQTEGGPQPT